MLRDVSPILFRNTSLEYFNVQLGLGVRGDASLKSENILEFLHGVYETYGMH